MTTNRTKQTNRTQTQRYGGLLGVAGAALALGGGIAMATLEFMPTGVDAVESLTDDTGRILGGGQLLAIGAVLLVAFGAILNRRISDVAPDSALGTIAGFGYALAGLAGAFSIVGYAGGALRVQEQDSIAQGQAATMVDLSMVTIGAVVPVMLAIGIGATALASIRAAGIVPTWLGWVGAPIAVGLMILPINYLVLPLGLLWTIAAGVTLSPREATVVDVSSGGRQAVAV